MEKITVSKERVEVRFRTNGIERVAGELGPIRARSHHRHVGLSQQETARV